ncbi:muraminidase, partial [Salmonella enterica subsp. enterica serovar Typhimurium]
MQISSNGITRLKREEGERLKAYPDSRGIPTIGVGHTGKVDGNPV